jgi:hypothetical protein
MALGNGQLHAPAASLPREEPSISTARVGSRASLDTVVSKTRISVAVWNRTPNN